MSLQSMKSDSRVGKFIASATIATAALSTIAYVASAKTVLRCASGQCGAPLKVEVPNGASGRRVMVICGWGGALPKHLRRLVEMYQSKGFATVLVLPAMVSFLENAAFIGAGAELLLVLRDHLLSLGAHREGEGEERPSVYIHTHSNTSTFYYYSVMRCMQFAVFRPIVEAYCGTIYDSNPGHPGVHNIAPPKGTFRAALEAYYAAHPRAEQPMALNTMDAAASSGAEEDPLRTYVKPLSLNVMDWASTAFTRNTHPIAWASAAAIMSMVCTPIVLRRQQYVHPLWTPLCFVVCFKEYAQSTLRGWANRVGNVFIKDEKKKRPLETRFGRLFSPMTVPSMERAAKLIADSNSDGFAAGDEALVMQNLTALHCFCAMQNFDVRYPMPRPELFIYSEKDGLVPPRDTERYIYARATSPFGDSAATAAAAAVPHVFAHKFSKTPHVAHFLKSPVIYVEVIDNFVAFCDAYHKKASADGEAPIVYPARWYGMGCNFP